METLNTWLSQFGPHKLAINYVDIKDPKNHENKQLCSADGMFVFSDEWETRRNRCENFLKSSLGISTRKIYARDCEVERVQAQAARTFFDEHHIQGSNKLGLVFFGLYKDGELLGVMSLGRHPRKIDNTIVLDRLCFANGIQVVGGASRLFSRCTKWAKKHDYDAIISWSDNRWSSGGVYKAMGFTLEKEFGPDYSYVEGSGNRLSKQSQKKSAVKCPEGLTEYEWATARGLTRIWDKGKKRWFFKLQDPKDQSVRSQLSQRCAQQHASGVFKHSHIRGYFKSAKNKTDVYYSSSYELRCLYLLEADPNVESFKRCETFSVETRSRNPDIDVMYLTGRAIIEVKPKVRLSEPEVAAQIADTSTYCVENDIDFQIWTEDDSGFKSEKEIIKWAREFIYEQSGDDSLIRGKRERNCARSKKHYRKHIAGDTVTVYCEFCKCDHTPLRQTYNKALEKKGRFICEREGGFIAGSKPKPKKINPYAAEGKKLCTGACGQVLEYDKFGADKSRSDGYASSCKECRTKKAMEKYNDKKGNT